MAAVLASAGDIRRFRIASTGKVTEKQNAIQRGLLPSIRQLLAHADHEIVFEAAYLISSIAREGPIYVYPILKSDILPLLLRYLCVSAPPRNQLALLKCLNSVANNLPPKETEQWSEDDTLPDLLYQPGHADLLVSVIRSSTGSLISQQICDLTISLICKTCRLEQHRRTLADHGILSALAHRLASFVVAEGLIPPSLEAVDFPHNVATALPSPIPKHARLSPVLEAIAVLLDGSKDRAERFIGDAVLSTVFPQAKGDFTASDARQVPWGQNPTTTLRTRHTIEALLPSLPAQERSRSTSNLNFPPLGSGGPMSRRRSSFHPVAPQMSNVMLVKENRDGKDEPQLIPFLLYIARSARGRRRLLACKLLVILHGLGLVPKSRSRTFSALLVPILVRMLDATEPLSEGIANNGAYMASGLHYSKAVPAVLGALIVDDEELQAATVESRAIGRLASALKKTFEPSAGRNRTPWRPDKETPMEVEAASEDCMLGRGGPSTRLRHEMTYREGTLQALAAIAPFNDDYRKQICDQGVLAQIILSMEPYMTRTGEIDEGEGAGNSSATILAACGCVRALTRSVTALRTKLVDAEVVKSIIRLMNIPDPELRIAATKVLANLAMDFSPMKESVGETDVVKKLCEQAHSANARLRLESIWALKQLVVNATEKLKMEVVNELGSSWIRLLIRTDPYDIPEGEVIGLIVDKEYPPRQSITEDVVMSEDSEGEEGDDFADASPHPFEPDDDFNRHTPESDLDIQEQVLDLLRNLFCGDTASKLVDYVLMQMGRSDFFDILRKRLVGRRSYGATRKDNIETPPPVAIVSKVLYIVIHIAACSQHWRKSVGGQSALLKTILSFHNHAEREIRTQICWIAINLMYEDDISDKASCRQRAMELSKAGYREKIGKLEKEDPEMDVRERAKTAAHLFSELLDKR